MTERPEDQETQDELSGETGEQSPEEFAEEVESDPSTANSPSEADELRGG